MWGQCNWQTNAKTQYLSQWQISQHANQLFSNRNFLVGYAYILTRQKKHWPWNQVPSKAFSAYKVVCHHLTKPILEVYVTPRVLSLLFNILHMQIII